jgi:hypothetical protein
MATTMRTISPQWQLLEEDVLVVFTVIHSLLGSGLMCAEAVMPNILIVLFIF